MLNTLLPAIFDIEHENTLDIYKIHLDPAANLG